jgi:hypothetical protein
MCVGSSLSTLKLDHRIVIAVTAFSWLPNVVQTLTHLDPRRLAAAGLAMIVVVGCSRASERAQLERFFSASRLRDTTALHNIATVVFEPRERGTITTFEILNVAVRQDGGRQFKDVTIAAPVRLPTLQVVQQKLVVTLEQVADRWMIIGVKL